MLKISDSALAAEICAGPHNRLLRRQHCSSLCSQSEGHEHIANMASALGHDFDGFSARAWPPQYSTPSLCEQSELQCFASDLRQMSARCPLLRCHIRYAICLKTAQRFFWILNTLPLTPSPPFLALSLSANLGADASESGSGRIRIWEQTRPNLGADALAAGSRDADKHRERKGGVL